MLESRIRHLWATFLNNPYWRLAELVVRGELDDVFEGITEPTDDYVTCLKKLQELVAREIEFLETVNGQIKCAIQELEWVPEPATETPIEE